MRQGTIRGVGLLVLCLLGVAVGPADAANWPRFRGPNGTGIAEGQILPVDWTAQNILWRTEIPGIGNSSPIVWGDRIFLQSSTEDGKQRMLLCLDASTGKIIWSQSIPGTMAHTHQRNTLASSTPATDGERVYIAFWNGTNYLLHAYDFDGKLVWQRDLGSYASQHGAGHSPIVHDGLVIFPNDQDGASVLLAVDAKTGKNVWQVPRRAFRACYSTPFLLERDGKEPELIVVSTAGISGYNPKTGAENWVWNWTFSGMPLRTVSSPILAQGLIMANSGDGGGARHSIAVKPGDKGDVTDTNLAWENKRTFPYVPAMLTVGEHIYFVNDRGIAACHLAKNGENVWSERLGGGFTASPVLVDGKVYAVSEEGNVYVFLASPEFRLLARNSLGENVMASPAVANNRLYIRGKKHLFCIGKPGE